MRRTRHGRVARTSLALSLAVVATVVGVAGPPAPARAAPAAPAAHAAPATVAASYTNPLTGFDLLQDPHVLWDEASGKYHAYFGNAGGDYFYVPYFQSTDLATWTLQLANQVLASPGAWVDTGAFTNVGSPSVREVSAGSWVMYFTAVGNGTNGSVAGKKCIGAATGTDPDGPFTGLPQPLLCPAGAGDEVMDPSPIPGTPVPQIVFRRTGAQPGIYNVMLAAGATQPHATMGTPVRIWAGPGGTAWPEGSSTWQTGTIDDPSVVISPAPGNGPQLLFSGTDPVTGARMVGTVRCPGGWALGVVNDCDDAPLEGGRLFASTGSWNDGSGTHPGVVSPGGPQVFADEDGHPWIAYHAQPTGACTGGGCNGNLYLDRFCFAGGVPRTSAPTGTTQSTTRSATCTTDIPTDWTTTWATGVEPGFWNYHPQLPGQTWRQMVHATVGGSAVRVRLTNGGNAADLTIEAASVGIAPSSQTSSAQLQTPVPLTFGGAASVTLPPGQTVYSDAAVLAIPDDRDVGVSLYFDDWPVGMDNRAGSTFGEETSFVGTGNLVAGTGPGGFTAAGSNVQFVASVEVLAMAPEGAVVVLADSLTDGSFFLNAPDQEAMWPARVNDRLRAAGSGVSVVNAAIIGNTVLPGGNGPAVPERLYRDALAHAGVDTVFLEIGANDLYFPDAGSHTPSEITQKANAIVAAYQDVVTRSHAAGLRVVAATIPPYAWRSKTDWSATPTPPSPLPWTRSLYECFLQNTAGYPAESGPTVREGVAESVRDQVNARIRPGSPGSLAFDAVVDFDVALADPADDRRPRRDLLGLDCVHLTPTVVTTPGHPAPPVGQKSGQQALGDSVALAVVDP